MFDLRALSVCMISLALTTGASAQVCGDCNQDGVVSILDALRAAQISASLVPEPTPHCFSDYTLCNVSGDLCPQASSQISITDALVLAQVAAGLSVGYGCGTALGQPPMCMTTAPAGGSHFGDITISFDVTDPDSPSVSITVEHSTDGGVTFALSTPAATSPAPLDVNPGTASPGSSYDFIWDSVTDLGAATVPGVLVQITVDDGVTATTCTTPSFDVDNLTWQPCALGAVSILANPGFETGTMAGWNAPAYQVDIRAHDGNWSAWGMGNNAVRQTFPAVPCSQIQEWNYWGMHPTENVFGVTEYTYSDSTTQVVIHAAWMAWTYFDLLSTLNLSKSLVEVRVWGYSGGGGAPDETIFDSFNLCWSP